LHWWIRERGVAGVQEFEEFKEFKEFKDVGILLWLSALRTKPSLQSRSFESTSTPPKRSPQVRHGYVRLLLRVMPRASELLELLELLHSFSPLLEKCLRISERCGVMGVYGRTYSL